MAAMLSSARSGTPADVGHNPSPAGHHHNSNSPQDDSSYNHFVPSGNGNMANARALMGLQHQISGGVMEHNQLRQNMIPEENDPRLMTDILAIVNQLVRQQHHQQNQQQQHHQHQYQQQQQQQHQQQLQQQIHQQHFQQQRQSNTFSNNNLFPMGGSSLRSGSDMDAGRSSSYIGGYGFMSNGLGRMGSSIGMGSVGSTSNGSYSMPMTASRGYSGQHNTNSPHNANSTGSFSGHHSAPWGISSTAKTFIGSLAAWWIIRMKKCDCVNVKMKESLEHKNLSWEVCAGWRDGIVKWYLTDHKMLMSAF